MGQESNYAIFGFLLATAVILCSCAGGDRKAGKFVTDPIDTITPGTWTTDYVRDYSYAEGRIFDLAYPGEIGPYDSVAVLVFEGETNANNPDAFEVYFQTGPLDPGGYYDAANLRMKDITADGGWEILYEQDTTRCPVAIVFYASQRRALGVILEVTHMDVGGMVTGVDTIGHKSNGIESDTIRVLRPLATHLIPSNPAWSLMWRNCYRVPRNVAIEDFEVKVFRGLPGREGATSSLDYQEVGGVVEDPYIKILGLDQWNNSVEDTKLPDGKIDNRIETYRPEWGLVIFPHREPFNTATTFMDAGGDHSDTLLVKVPTLYDHLSTVEKVESSQYYLQIRVWQPDCPGW